jgi:DDB1- and CUL4-associated factor 1
MAEDYNLTADEENAQRQVVRHVCVALKKYFESHLFFKYTLVSRNSGSGIFPMRALRNPTEVVNDQIMNLQNLLPIKSSWQPVNVFLQLGGVKLLILVVAHSYEWNYSGRAETVRSALDVLNICCVMPKVHAVLCERIEFPEEGNAAGINIVLGAAEGEIVADPDVQKSALSLLVNCICAPLQRVSGSVGRFGSAKKKFADKNSEEFIQKVWETVRSNNGIIVLLQLITTKTPITDADCLRGMACRALAGLARSETVRQIISKLPIFVSGQLQQLMRDPILQEKRAEHVQFQKYALELIERISGKAINVDTSLANIHKANVVAQTKIQFNEKQLLFLIHRHLMDNGLEASANLLLREGKLDHLSIPNIKSTPSDSMLMNYRSPVIQRLKINKRAPDSLNNHCYLQNDTLEIERTPHAIKELQKNDILTPIKLIKKQANSLQSPQQQQSTSSSLEKQPTTTIFISNHKNAPSTSSPVPACVSLNTIVTEYLTNQHSLCKNPMATCPTFDLFKVSNY